MPDTLRVSGSYKIDNVKEVQQEEMGTVVGTGYDTIWSAVFTMDPIVKKKTE
jgi:hypothetical protein